MKSVKTFGKNIKDYIQSIMRRMKCLPWERCGLAVEGSECFVSFVHLQGALLPALKLDAMSPGETKLGGDDEKKW